MNIDPAEAAPSRPRGHNAPEPTPVDDAVVAAILGAIRRVRHGAVTVTVQDGRVVQIEVTEKRRF